MKRSQRKARQDFIIIIIIIIILLYLFTFDKKKFYIVLNIYIN